MSTSSPYYRGPPSDHFDGLRFFNPGQKATDRTLVDVLSWKLAAKRVRWPRSIPVHTAKPAKHATDLTVTMIGHASVLIQADGINLLVDPVWSERASPVAFAGPRRVTVPGVDWGDLPPIHAVLITHNHYDHMDIATLWRLHQVHQPVVVTPLGNDVILRRFLPASTIVPLDWQQAHQLTRDLIITCVPAHHWSARGQSDRRMALWGGFVVRTPRRIVYVVGDTGYGDGAIFRALPLRHGTLDLAVIPIGAYEPRWFMEEQHVNPWEAVQIFCDCKAERAVGVHWGTFQLTDEGRDEPRLALAQALAASGISASRFVALEPGMTWHSKAAAGAIAASADGKP